MRKFKKLFVILGVASSLNTFLSLPLLANTKQLTGKVDSLLNKSQPVIKAKNNLEKACDLGAGMSKKMDIGSSPEAMSTSKKTIKRVEQVQKACSGSVVSNCMYDAVESDIATPDKVLNNPSPYINKTVSCIDKTAKDILKQRELIKKEVLEATSANAVKAKEEAERAAKIAAEKAKKEAKAASDKLEREKKKAEEAANREAEKAKNTGKKIKNFFKR